MEGLPVTVTGVPTKCGTVLAPAASARAADPGDSTVKWPGPEFPAATAKTMFASSRLSTAMVNRSWKPWDPPPRLMLPTSKPSAYAASIALRMSSERALSTSSGKTL